MYSSTRTSKIDEGCDVPSMFRPSASSFPILGDAVGYNARSSPATNLSCAGDSARDCDGEVVPVGKGENVGVADAVG